MSLMQARQWILLASLLLCGVIFGFFLVSPALGYPLTFDEALRLLQLVFPVFTGYVGQASYFLFSDSPISKRALPEQSRLLGLMLKGPIMLFGVAFCILAFVFAFSNRHGTPIGAGMAPNQFAMALSILLGLLTVSTNVAVSYIFRKETK